MLRKTLLFILLCLLVAAGRAGHAAVADRFGEVYALEGTVKIVSADGRVTNLKPDQAPYYPIKEGDRIEVQEGKVVIFSASQKGYEISANSTGAVRNGKMVTIKGTVTEKEGLQAPSGKPVGAVGGTVIAKGFEETGEGKVGVISQGLLQGRPLPFKTTVAILPLENISKNREMDWLSEGIPELMIAKLQNVRSLHMVERTRTRRLVEEMKLSMSRLADSATTQKAGKFVGADTVLIGSFMESRGEVRITMRLIQVEKGSVLHAIEETGRIDQIFQIQDRLAERLVAALGYRMEADEGRRMTLAATSSLQAYQFYVRGRDQYFRFNREGYEKAVEFYREAIRLDPGFVLAHAGIGDALATLSYSRRKAGESYEGLLREAREAAENAVALNPASSEAHRALAHVHDNAFNFQDSRREAEKALALNPNDAEAWYLLGQAATTVPDLDRAEICYNHALRLNSHYVMAYNSLGWYVYLERKWYDKAVEVFKRAIQISPDFTDAYDSLGEAYFRMGRYEEAAAAFKKALEFQPSHTHAGQRYRETMEKIMK